jgi:hypothetical protein
VFWLVASCDAVGQRVTRYTAPFVHSPDERRSDQCCRFEQGATRRGSRPGNAGSRADALWRRHMLGQFVLAVPDEPDGGVPEGKLEVGGVVELLVAA